MSKSHEVIHRSKFMDGKMTPQELHRWLGLRGMKCQQCGAPAATRLRVLVPLEELMHRQPELVAQIMKTNPNGPTVPTVPTIYGPMVKISEVGACSNCTTAAERAAARCPSWCIVEIDRGPEHKNPVSVQVPRAAG